MNKQTNTALILLFGSCAFLFGIIYSHNRHIDEIRTFERAGEVIHYQVLGKQNANPVILLHGNGGCHEHLSVMAEQLDSAGYLVYAMDSRGQGMNRPIGEYHYVDMAEDVAYLIQEENINHPAVFGWSDGGIIALQTEVLHPGTFSAICTSGANIFPEGVPNVHTLISTTDSLGNPIELEPLQRMMLFEPQMTAEDMQTIQCKALIVAGEYDLIAEEHTRLIANHIPHGELLILPGEDHGSHIWQNKKMGEIFIDWMKEAKVAR